MRFIGDIHGNVSNYSAIVENALEHGVKNTIQVGDFGMGFKIDYEKLRQLNGNNYFIRGNHDNLDKCREYTDSNLEYIPDGASLNIEGREILFVGGAFSIDWQLRKEGVSWWRNEELSISELYDIIDAVVKRNKSYDIIVSHDCPESACGLIQNGYVNFSDWNSRTRHALEEVLVVNKPKMWVHGHWHLPRRFIHKGTEFISLEEFGFVDV
jgi:predicted phosphodiesterase